MRTTLLRPLSWLRTSRVQSELELLPRPAESTTRHGQGPAPDRVLLFGNGVAVGFGVSSQTLGLSGHLSRELPARTAREAQVDVVAEQRTTVKTATKRLTELASQRYDAIVLTLGATDAMALLPPAHWREGLEAVLDALIPATSTGTAVVLVGIPSVQRSVYAVGVGDVVDRHAARLNKESADICAERGVTFVALDGDPGRPGSPASSEDYQRLATRIAAVVAPALTWLADQPGATAARQGADTDLVQLP